MLVDSHCHLDFEVLDFSTTLDNAIKNDVAILQTICTKIKDFNTILEIAGRSERVLCSVGNHPLNLKEEGLVKAEEIIDFCSHPKVIGIGETGLDYHYDNSPDKKLQQQSFEEHIKASQETGLPLIVHARDADSDIISIMKSLYKQKNFKAVIHCFTGGKELAYGALDLGFYISASGIVTFKNAKEIQKIFSEIPLDRILIETDAPYLAPVPHRGKTNEPAFLKHTAKFLANLRQMTYDEIAKATTENFFRLFDKATKFKEL